MSESEKNRIVGSVYNISANNQKLKKCPICGRKVNVDLFYLRSVSTQDFSMDYFCIYCTNCRLYLKGVPFELDTSEELKNEWMQILIDRWNSRKYPGKGGNDERNFDN